MDQDFTDRKSDTGQRLFYPWKPEHEEGSNPADAMQRMYKRTKKKAREAIVQWSILDWVAFFIPAVGWLRTYPWNKWLVHDLVAGVSVGFMVVPQGMSYANSAGLPSVYGLYGAFLPCLVYSLLGTSRQLAVGPVAVTSLLIASNLKSIVTCAQNISNPNTPSDPACQAQYNQAAIQLAFIVACLYSGIGILRLGWVTKLLSHAVISGFTTGAAITIAMGQVKYILGFKITTGSHTQLDYYMKQYVWNMQNFRWQEFILGVMTMLILIAFKFGEKVWRPLRFVRSLGPLFVCIMGIAAVVIGEIDTPDRGGISIVGAIPSGLPPFTGTEWTPMVDPSFKDLIVTAIIVMFVDLLESTSIARALARKNGYELIYNREILGLGIANFAGAMSSCYTTTGSFSRSAVNNNAGAKSPLAQFVCGWVVALVLLTLTSVFSKLPFAVMGAIVIVSVASLIEFEQAVYLFKVSKLDLLCWLASCIGTLFISVEIGLAIAVGVAIMLALYQSAFPHTAVLGRIGGSVPVYRNVKQYPDSQLTPGILAFRVDAPMYFANVKALEDKIEKAMVKFCAWSSVQGVAKIHFLVIDMTPVHHVDSMGLHFLEDLVFDCKKKGMTLLLANPSRAVIKCLEQVKLPDLLGKEFVFVSMQDAMAFAQQRLAEMGFSSTAFALPQSSDVLKQHTIARNGSIPDPADMSP